MVEFYIMLATLVGWFFIVLQMNFQWC